MPILLWDASALAKRYAPETGTETVDALFASIPLSQMVATVIGFAETHSLLLRKRNRGNISQTAFTVAKTSLRDEVVNNTSFTLLTVDDTAVFAGIVYMEAHNINATDAAILALFMRYVLAVPPSAPPCVVVAADERLVRAAQAEGLTTLNPEHVPAADVPAVLASP